jgi:adenine/guanine/hypoxanthine permease
MPNSLVLAVGAGIGLFIAFIGLSPSGLSVIGGDTTNFVGLGGCLAQDMQTNLPNYCNTRVLRDPTVWLGIFTGGFLTVLLMLYRVKGALLIGITLTSIISWPRPTSVTAFPYTEAGDAAFDFFKQVVTFRPIGSIANALDVSKFSSSSSSMPFGEVFCFADLWVCCVVQLWQRQGLVCAYHFPLC